MTLARARQPQSRFLAHIGPRGRICGGTSLEAMAAAWPRSPMECAATETARAFCRVR